MTRKQKRFREEYLIDMNATQAAIRAGYSPDTAKSIGSENLTFVRVLLRRWQIALVVPASMQIAW